MYCAFDFSKHGMHWGGGKGGHVMRADKRRKPVCEGNGWGASKGAWGWLETGWEDVDQKGKSA